MDHVMCVFFSFDTLGDPAPFHFDTAQFKNECYHQCCYQGMSDEWGMGMNIQIKIALSVD